MVVALRVSSRLLGRPVWIRSRKTRSCRQLQRQEGREYASLAIYRVLSAALRSRRCRNRCVIRSAAALAATEPDFQQDNLPELRFITLHRVREIVQAGL